MKKITLTALTLIGLVFSVKAQIQKGNVLIGSDLANLQLGLSKPTSFTVPLPQKQHGLSKIMLHWVHTEPLELQR